MFVKILFRLLRIAGAVIGVLVTTAGVAGFLALQEPAYYTELRQQPVTPQEAKTANDRLHLERSAYLAWRGRLPADQRGGRAPVVHEVRYTAAHLNALLASEWSGFGEAPRLRVKPGAIDFACGIVTPIATCVVSAELKPQLTPHGVLILELESAQVGRLPLPCKTLFGLLPKERRRLSGKLYLDLTGPNPLVSLDLSDKNDMLLAQSIECGEGDFVVRFMAQRPAD